MQDSQSIIQGPRQLGPDLAGQLLKLMPEALVVVDRQQGIVHLNPQAEKLFQRLASELIGQPLEVLLPEKARDRYRALVSEFLHSPDQMRLLQDREVLKARRKDGQEFFFLGTIAKLYSSDKLYLAVVIKEITESLRADKRRKDLERSLRALSDCLGSVVRAKDEPGLLSDICKIVVTTGGYPFVWIGYPQNDQDKTVKPMAKAGKDQGYLAEVFVSWGEGPFGQGPAGRAIKTGRPQFSRQIAKDQGFAKWRDQALSRDFRSSASFPLILEGKPIAALNLYSRSDNFDREEIELLNRLTENLALGIYSLRSKARQEKSETLLREKAFELTERVKELGLFYNLSRLKGQEGLTLAEALKQIVLEVPAAWQFPDLAEAKISIKAIGEFKTKGYQETPYRLRHQLYIQGQAVGEIEVVYTSWPEDKGKDPFLPEEYQLLESLAQNIEDLVHNLQNQAERRKLSRALEQTEDTVMITDREGNIEYVNPAFERLTGFSRQEVMGKKPNILKSGQYDHEFYSRMWRTLLKGRVYKDTVINRKKDGSIYYEYKTITPLHDQAGELTHFLATGKDLTQQLQAKSRLQYLSAHDPVTGLINQDELIRKLDRLVDIQSSSKENLAVIVLGLDNFEAVNQSLGRIQGEQVLKILGQRLSGADKVEAVAKLAGDKFCVLFKTRDSSRTLAMVQRCLDLMAKPFAVQGEEVAVTVSAGISCCPTDGRQAQRLLQKAETALVRARSSGISRFEFFTQDMQASSLERLRLNKALLDALD